MITKLISAALALSLTAGAAFAGEGNGDPFPFQAEARTGASPALTADTGSGAYPEPRSGAVQPSSLAQLEPAPGSEAPLQTALSLPRGAGQGTVAYVQAQRLTRYAATRPVRRRRLEVSSEWPRG